MPLARAKLISSLSSLVYFGGILAVNEDPVKVAKVFMIGQPTMDVKNARGRVDFSIQLRAGDPVKYSWNYQATDGYFSSTPFAYKQASVTAATFSSGTRRYTATNTFAVGDYVTVSGTSPSGWQLSAATLVTAVHSGGTWFEVTAANPGVSYTSGGTARLAYSKTSITNDGNTAVPTVVTITGPMSSGSFIKNLTNGNSMKLVKQLRPANYTVSIASVSRTANIATVTATSSTGHGLFVGDIVNITVTGASSFDLNGAVIVSTTTNTFTYVSTGSDQSLTTVTSSNAVLVSADSAIIDTYNQTVTYRGIADAGRSILDANIDWLKLNPGTNEIQIETGDTSVSTTATTVAVQYRSGWIG
jgi:hypothetical protein